MGKPQTLKGLWAGDLVDQVTIHIDQGFAIGRLIHQVTLPEFIEQSLRRLGSLHVKPCVVEQWGEF